MAEDQQTEKEKASDARALKNEVSAEEMTRR